MADELRVEYPTDPLLRAVGRVAVIGILLRLRTPMLAVEQFRNDLDAALARAAGTAIDGAGTLRVVVRWNDEEVIVDVEGPGGSEQLRRERVHRPRR